MTIMIIQRILCRMVLAVALILVCMAGPFTTQAATNTVVFKDFSFTPQSVTIQVGDTVVWTNAGGTHTVTGDGADPFCGGAAVAVSCSETFTNAGTFPYHCVFHQAFGMVGTVIVSPAPTGTNMVSAVTIISPTNNTTLATPGSITIEASTPSGTTFTKVEFFDNNNSIGVASTSPYSISASLSAGTHSITAKATDSSGADTTSAAVTVIVKFEIEDPIPAKIAKGDITIELQTILDGLVSPLGMAAPDDGSGRLFVYDQVGLIYVLTNGAKMNVPLLDIRSRLVNLDGIYDERGLLGVATHPNFAQKPLIYTYTSEPNGPAADFMIPVTGGTTNDHQSVITEWRIDSANPNLVDLNSRREILRIDKPQSNHNGGSMRFGPDGFLYFTVGDGGAADDQGDGHSDGGNGQDKSKILGKVIRIDIDTKTSPNGQYGIPSDNPFVGQIGVVQEIYAYGLRNPYSFSFDRQTGDILLGDVGQNQVEEVDKIVKGGNYGWSIKEGGFLFNANGTNDGFVTLTQVRTVPADLIDPIAQYDHDEGDAIIGGFVYRGSVVSSLSGKYVTGDWGEFEGPEGRLFFLDGSQLKELRIGSDDRPLGLWLKGFGQDSAGELYVCGSTNSGPSGTSGKVLKIVSAGSVSAQNSFTQHNFISDVAGQGDRLDTNLVNAWGIAFGPTGPFWVADNHTGVSTLYNTAGATLPLVVNIPVPAGGQPPSSPTGIIFNNTPDFLLPSGKPASFIFATEDGTIAAWNQGTNAILKADNSASSAIYKGLALGNSGGKNYLYATDFHNGKVDVFGGDFSPATLAGSFNDPNIPAGFAPFNIQNLGGNLYVTYAKQDDDKEDDERGEGNGFVDIYDTSGNLVTRLISNGPLNSPWGLTIAPASFGQFGGALLVGNFGNGAINAFIPTNGVLLGSLQDAVGKPISIEGLWALTFGNGVGGGDTGTLYFTAGPADETHGLFGSITWAGRVQFTAVTASSNSLTLSWSGGTGPYLIQEKLSLTDTNWMNLLTTSNTTVTVARVGAAGFFRVSDQATTTVSQLTASLNGASERPPVETLATGSGILSVEGNILAYSITFSGLSGPAIAAHIHGPADPSQAVGVIKGLNFTPAPSGVMSGTIDLSTLTPEQANAIKAGNAYVNIHTAVNPSGEIRGQIMPQ